MTLQTPTCPDCQAALTKTAAGRLDQWVCPAGHGAAVTLSEAHGVAQDDELDALWQTAKQAAAGPRACPMDGTAMAAVALPYDADEEPAGPGDTPLGEVDLDVCAACQVIWFEPGELEALPADLPEPQLTPAQQAELETISAAFSEGLDEVYRQRDERDLGERIYHRLARRPRLLAFMQRHRS